MAGPVVERGLCLEQSETIAKVSSSPSEVVAVRRARRSGGAPRKAMAHGWTRRNGVMVAWRDRQAATSLERQLGGATPKPVAPVLFYSS